MQTCARGSTAAVSVTTPPRRGAERAVVCSPGKCCPATQKGILGGERCMALLSASFSGACGVSHRDGEQMGVPSGDVECHSCAHACVRTCALGPGLRARVLQLPESVSRERLRDQPCVLRTRGRQCPHSPRGDSRCPRPWRLCTSVVPILMSRWATGCAGACFQERSPEAPSPQHLQGPGGCRVLLTLLRPVFPGSPGGFAPGGFGPKAAPPKGASSWQTSRPPVQGAPWAPQTKPPPKTSAQPRPNYTTNFSVIGGREERGVRLPSFGEFLLFSSV